jgi:hypothetical protein
MYGLRMSARGFSSDELDEDMADSKLRTTPDRNSSKRKHDIQTSGNPGGYIGKN